VKKLIVTVLSGEKRVIFTTVTLKREEVRMVVLSNSSCKKNGRCVAPTCQH
jgi:hypothetical protein